MRSIFEIWGFVMDLIKKFWSLDAYPTINEDFYSRTLSGGLITLTSSIVMLLLFISELTLVENLTSKVKAWEIEKGIPFLYDKALLLCTLEEYAVMRQEKEEEKRRFLLESALRAAETAQASVHAERANSRALIFKEEDFKSLQLQYKPTDF